MSPLPYVQPGSGLGAMGQYGTGAPSMSALGSAYGTVQASPVSMDLGQYNYLQGQANAGVDQLNPYMQQQLDTGRTLGNVAGQMGNTIGGLGQTQQNIQQQNLADMGATQEMLRQRAMGQGPSAAQAQLQQGLQQSQNAAMAQANSARGNFGLANAQKNAMQTGANLAQQTNQAAALARAQEQIAAGSQLQQQQQQMLGAQQTIGNLQQAQLAGQTGMGNMYAQQGGLINNAGALQQQAIQDYMQQAGLAGTTANQAANVGLQNSAQNLGAQQFNIGEGDKELGGIMGAAGGLASLAAA